MSVLLTGEEIARITMSPNWPDVKGGEARDTALLKAQAGKLLKLQIGEIDHWKRESEGMSGEVWAYDRVLDMLQALHREVFQ